MAKVNLMVDVTSTFITITIPNHNRYTMATYGVCASELVRDWHVSGELMLRPLTNVLALKSNRRYQNDDATDAVPSRRLEPSRIF